MGLEGLLEQNICTRQGGYVQPKFSSLGELACIDVRAILSHIRRAYIPKQIPRDSSLSFETDVARFASERRT